MGPPLTVWDVAVVGAGPAGATAARAAAQAGARTVLVERAELPRYKTCGGGVVGLARGALPAGLPSLERDRIDTVTFTSAGRRQVSRRQRRGGPPLLTMVARSELDSALAAAAVQAGAVLRIDAAVTGVSERGGVVTLSCRGGERVSARTVVGADGTGGRLGHYVGVRTAQVDLGLEAELAVGPERAARWRGRLLLDWGRLPGSYGWVFPKGELLTVGVIGSRGAAEGVRAYYRDLLDRLGLATVPRVHDTGHLTRCRRPDSPLRSVGGGVLVAGDAAGLLEPWTREGISYALRSGVLAGRRSAAAARALAAGQSAAAEHELAAYPVDVTGTLAWEMTAGAQLLGAFDRHRELFHALLASPLGWRLFRRLVSGDTTLAAQLRRPVGRAALRLAAC